MGRLTAMDTKTGWPYGKVMRGTHKPIAPPLVAPVLGRQAILGDGVMYDRAKLLEALRNDPTNLEAARLWSVELWPPDDPDQGIVRPGWNNRSQVSGLAPAGDVGLASGDIRCVSDMGRIISS
jgi:hypothetical protein